MHDVFLLFSLLCLLLPLELLSLTLALSLTLSLTLTLTRRVGQCEEDGRPIRHGQGGHHAGTCASKQVASLQVSPFYLLPIFLTHALIYLLTTLLAPRSRATLVRRRATRRRRWSSTRYGTRPASRGRTTPPPSSSSSGRRPPPPPPPPQGRTHSPSPPLPLKWAVAASALSCLWRAGFWAALLWAPAYLTLHAGLLWAPAY